MHQGRLDRNRSSAYKRVSHDDPVNSQRQMRTGLYD